MNVNNKQFKTVLLELDNHYSNLGIGWIHPALLLNLLTYREKSLSTLKNLIQENKGTGPKSKFYMGVFKFLRDTIKNGVPGEITNLSKEGLSINTLNSLSIYLNIIRVNIRKIISFARWIKGIDEPERKIILRFLVKHLDNLLYAKVIEELLFLESSELLENLTEVFENIKCSPFGIVLLKEYLRVGFYSNYQKKFELLLDKYKKEECNLPEYTPVDEDYSRFITYATPPNMGGSQTLLVARRENLHFVDIFNFTVSPNFGLNSFTYQENVPFALFREFTEEEKDEYEKVDVEYVIDLMRDAVFDMKVLSQERAPEFAFYRKFLGEDALEGKVIAFVPENVSTNIPEEQLIKLPVIQKWLYNSSLLNKLFSDPSLNSFDKFKEELFDHIDIIRESLRRMVMWAKYSNHPDYKGVLLLYKKAQNINFLNHLAKEIWENRINLYMATK